MQVDLGVEKERKILERKVHDRLETSHKKFATIVFL